MTTTLEDSGFPPTSYQETVSALGQEVLLRLTTSSSRRFMLGIAGGPGAGKSTFAESLCREVNALSGAEIAIVVPMDGFHKTNRELRALDLWERKGEPETFEAEAFVGLLQRIREHPDRVSTAPLFDRQTDEPVADSLQVHPSHEVVIVEGNYLLLPTAPWDEIRGILDDVWYLEAPEDVVVRRLEVRHLHRGLTGPELAQKIASSDLKNAERIAQGRDFASRILSLPVTPE